MDKAALYGSTMGPAHETAVAEASGPASGAKPAYFFLAMVAILLFVRFAYEWAD